MKTISISLLSFSPKQWANIEDYMYNIETQMFAAQKLLAKNGCQVNFGWHVDIMDGVYIKRITFSPEQISAVMYSAHMPVDLHFMTDSFALYESVNQRLANRSYVHLSTDCIYELARQEQPAKWSLALNPQEAVRDDILNESDAIMLMSVQPGRGGQPYISVADKIAQIRQYNAKNGKSVYIAVDGGVNLETAEDCKDADMFVVGSAFTKLTTHQIDFLVELGQIVSK